LTIPQLYPRRDKLRQNEDDVMDRLTKLKRQNTILAVIFSFIAGMGACLILNEAIDGAHDAGAVILTVGAAGFAAFSLWRSLA
jgi:hypothetical protein